MLASGINRYLIINLMFIFSEFCLLILPESNGHLAKRVISETEVNHEKQERRSNNANFPQHIYGIV